MLSLTRPLKNFPLFYDARRFITVFTRDCHRSLYTWIHSTPFPPFFLHISFNMSPPPPTSTLCLPSGPFFSVFPIKLLWAFFIVTMRKYMFCPSTCSGFDDANFRWRWQITKHRAMQFSLVCCRFIPLYDHTHKISCKLSSRLHVNTWWWKGGSFII